MGHDEPNGNNKEGASAPKGERDGEATRSFSSDQETLGGARMETPPGLAPKGMEEARPKSMGRWEHLELIAKVGEGAFGETYRARDTTLDREVALKLLKVDARVGQEVAGQLVREGALLARFRHQNVVTVYGAQQQGDRVGIWMEFIQGRTLESLVKEQGRLGEREAALIGVDVCRALAAVHGAGIIHRDIKAANVMREEGGRTVLMDFGLGLDVKAVEAGRGAGIAGTPFYMAPELLTGHPATVRSDLYGLGILLYYLVTGQFPITGSTLAELLEAHASRRATLLRDVRHDLSAGFIQVVERLLEREPERRFETAGSLEAALLDTIGGTGTIGRGETASRSSHAPDLSVAHFTEYRKERVAEWSHSRYNLDKEFVALTLLVDQGEDSAAGRWGARPETFRDLREVLAAVEDRVVVLLGPPGCGKSTLLRRFELDVAMAQLGEAVTDHVVPASGVSRQGSLGPGQTPPDTTLFPLTFFIQLNYYKPARPGDPPPEPGAWLAERWAARFPSMPPLPALLDAGRMVLLLDGLNEMAVTGPGGPRECVSRWKEFIDRLAAERPGNRVVFTCRALDYSAPLSTASLRVPQVLIEPMTDAQVEEYLIKIDPARGAGIWSQLEGTPQLEVMRSPYFLGMLLEQVASAGELPRGRASLFTGFVRRALRREVERDNPLFLPDSLLTDRDVRRIAANKWGNPWALPDRGVLIPKLSELAYGMQVRSEAGGASQVRVDYDEALDLLAHDHDEEIVKAGETLSVLDEDSALGEVKYIHQLVQEYFAGRRLSETPEPQRVRTPWKSAEIFPSLADTVNGLPPAETLPPLPTTGWEETALLAGSMSADPDGFVRSLFETHLCLAGRCAAEPEVLPRLSTALLEPLRLALAGRSRDPAADLRSRIEAGLALGLLGDPRLERRPGSHGAFIQPAMILIDGGVYPLGEDEPYESMGERWSDHVPRHAIDLAPFRIGQSPVTNAEWGLFMESGGYEDERWWDTEAALRWQRGEGTAEGIRAQVRYWLRRFRTNPAELEERWASRQIAEEIYERWKERLAMSQPELDAHLNELYPGGKLTEPLFWRDGTWNNPAQPVVGVSWFEAHAYTRWLAAQAAEPFRLPTEAEWEAAARGRSGRLYAYGDAFDPLRGNTAASRIRRTTPVGVFVEGETPEGLADLTGNVEEWTGSLFGAGGSNDPASFRYPYRPEDGREDPSAGADVRRVLRGGGWATATELARAANRVDSPPDYRFNHIGLRVAASADLDHRGA